MDIPLQPLLFSIPTIAYVVALRRRGDTWRQALANVGWQPSAPRYLLWGLALTAPLVGLGWAAIQWVPDDVLETARVNVSAYAGWSPTLMMFGLIWLREAIYVALGEEIFFRGFVGGWLMRRFGFFVGNTIQALVFLAPHVLLLTISIHFIGLVVVQFLAGWLFGWLRFRSGSILPGWLAHSLSNALGAFAMLAW